MRTPRHSYTAPLLADGKVLLAGGFGARGEYLSSAEIYNPDTGTFAPAGAMNEARAGHVSVRLEDGRVLVIGGVGPGWTFWRVPSCTVPEGQPSSLRERCARRERATPLFV